MLSKNLSEKFKVGQNIVLHASLIAKIFTFLASVSCIKLSFSFPLFLLLLFLFLFCLFVCLAFNVVCHNEIIIFQLFFTYDNMLNIIRSEMSFVDD